MNSLLQEICERFFAVVRTLSEFFCTLGISNKSSFSKNSLSKHCQRAAPDFLKRMENSCSAFLYPMYDLLYFCRFLRRGVRYVMRNYANVLVIITRLRQLCLHPILCKTALKDLDEAEKIMDQLQQRQQNQRPNNGMSHIICHHH